MQLQRAPLVLLTVVSAGLSAAGWQAVSAQEAGDLAESEPVATVDAERGPASEAPAQRAAVSTNSARSVRPVHPVRPAHPDPAIPSETDETRVVIEDRMPPGWFSHDPDRYPLRPERWRRRMPARCRTQGGYVRHCQGERRIATASPEGIARAERLGLGRRETVRWMMNKRPFPEWLNAVEHLGEGRRLTYPVPGGRLGRGFGRVRRGSVRNRPHKGIDIGSPEGSTIVAAQAGLVVYSDNEVTGYGNVVMLLHRGGYSTFYAHCEETLVGAGDFVTRGQAIAKVGSTGFAWAPHLHFEWRQRGWVRDPAPHLLPDENGRAIRRARRAAREEQEEDSQ